MNIYIWLGHNSQRMIEITDAASQELRQLLEKEDKSDYGLRIFVAGIGCGGIQYGLTLEKSPKKEDKVIQSKGIKICKELMDEVNELKIDYIDNEYGKGFVIDNPNAYGLGCSSCG